MKTYMNLVKSNYNYFGANNPANLLVKSVGKFNLPTLLEDGFDTLEKDAEIGLVGSVPGIFTVANFFAGSFDTVLKVGLII